MVVSVNSTHSRSNLERASSSAAASESACAALSAPHGCQETATPWSLGLARDHGQIRDRG